MNKNDIKILEDLMERAKSRDLGINSINYYYALKHSIEELSGTNQSSAAEEWLEFDSHPSSTTFICPHCREKVYFSHGSSHKARKHGIAKRCLYKFCPWCGQPVAPLRVNYISDEP